jgi:hypothetical protein
MEFCACEKEVCTLLRWGFWPSSPYRPRVAYAIDLLKLYHYLNVERQTLMKGFIDTLRWRNNLTEADVRNIQMLPCVEFCASNMQM